MSVRSIVTTDTVVFSLKTFLAAMLAYFIAISFDLPRPFWAVATVYIVAHPLSGAISSKSVYRLLGTLIGGGATIVMVPNLVNEPILLSAAIIAWVSACTFFSLLTARPEATSCCWRDIRCFLQDCRWSQPRRTRSTRSCRALRRSVSQLYARRSSAMSSFQLMWVPFLSIGSTDGWPGRGRSSQQWRSENVVKPRAEWHD